MVGRFDNKVVLITGAASGIGRVTALAFAQAGAALVLADIDEAGGFETQQLVITQGAAALFLPTDVSHHDDVAAAVLWLCSDEASFVNGAALPVDGGFTAQ